MSALLTVLKKQADQSQKSSDNQSSSTAQTNVEAFKIPKGTLLDPFSILW